MCTQAIRGETMKGMSPGNAGKLFGIVITFSLMVFVIATFGNFSEYKISTLNMSNDSLYAGKVVTDEELFDMTVDLEEVPVCGKGRAKTYMNYKLIKTKSTKQYKYIKSYMKVDEKGFLVDEDGFIGVALGSYFGEIGTKYIFTLEGGIELPLVKVEAKSDRHTINGCYQYMDYSVIEFVVDVTVAGTYYGVGGNGYVLNGNYGNKIKGAIVKIERVL